MDIGEVKRHWNANAKNWTKLSREGYDSYRDAFNTPAALAMLPDVRGLTGLDVGCGEGHNTRLVARKGASMHGIDISEVFVRYAAEAETREPLGICYQTADARDIPFPDATFDFVVSFMCFMDTPGIDRVFAECRRVLKAGGFLFFSILHPCFLTRHKKNVRNEKNEVIAVEVGNYFDGGENVDEWTFSSLPGERKKTVEKFRVPYFYRTLGEWLNTLIDTGFAIRRIGEPYPDENTVRQRPEIQDARVTAYFLHVLADKTN